MKTPSFLLAAAASVMLAACGSDDQLATADNQLRLCTQNALPAEGTRAGSSIQTTQFDNGEKVGIFLVENVNGTATTSGTNVTTYTQPLTYTADGSGNLNPSDPQYWPTSGNGLFIYGVYPSTAASSYNATGVSFSVQNDQSTDANYKASDLMTGAPTSNPVTRTSSAVPIRFTHLLTKVSVTLEAGNGFSAGDLSSAKVYITNTKPTTTFSVGNTTVGTASGTVSDITVCTGTSGSAIIVPQTLTANTNFIKVDVGGGSYYYAPTAQTTFAGQTEYNYTIKVNKTGLTVSSSIGAWNNGGSTSDTAVLQ